MEFEVPRSHILRPTLYADMVQRVLRWERQTNALVEKDKDPWQRNVVIIIFQYFFYLRRGGREDEDKKRQKNGQTLFYFIFPKLPYLGMHIYF